MCPGWWQRLHFRGFLAVDPVSEEPDWALWLLDAGPRVLPLPPGPGRAPKVPVGRVRGRLRTHCRGRKHRLGLGGGALPTFMQSHVPHRPGPLHSADTRHYLGPKLLKASAHSHRPGKGALMSLHHALFTDVDTRQAAGLTLCGEAAKWARDQRPAPYVPCKEPELWLLPVLTPAS